VKPYQEESLGAAYDRILRNRSTPQATIEAVFNCVRERGLGALKAGLFSRLRRKAHMAHQKVRPSFPTVAIIECFAVANRRRLYSCVSPQKPEEKNARLGPARQETKSHERYQAHRPRAQAYA
jgi:hypothetical protein